MTQNNRLVNPYALIEKGSEYLKLYPDGTIERTIEGAANYGRRNFNWRVTGAIELDNFSRSVAVYSLEHVLYDEIPWKHANGKQRTHIMDYDHGTHRMWGSPGHIVRPMKRPNLLTPANPWSKVEVCYEDTMVSISGPYHQSSMAYGKHGMADAAPTLQREEWYVSWNTFTLSTPDPDPDYERQYGPGTVVIPVPTFTSHIYNIVNFAGQQRYLVSRAYPSFEEPALDLLIRRLVVKGEKPRIGS